MEKVLMALKSEQALKLAKVLGDRLITAKHEMIIHSQDVGSLPKQVGWLMNTKPDAIAQPESPQDIQFLYEFARSEKVPLVPRGAGTSGYGGAIPRHGGIVVDMRRMDHVLSVDKENLTVTVEPGISWVNLQFELNRQGLDLRCYPSSGISATVGSSDRCSRQEYP
jgi:FAD/FMN-containing dehydrogenase